MTDLVAECAAALDDLDLPDAWQTRVRVNPRRTRIGLDVDEYAHLTVTVPPDATPAEVVRAVRRNELWVHRRVRHRAPYVPDHPVKDLVNGEGFPLLGRPHRLRIVEDGPLITETSPPTFSKYRTREVHVRRNALCAGPFITWYSRHGHAFMNDDDSSRSPLWWCRNKGIRAPELEVTTLKPRQWALYKPARHALAVHWALFQLDPDDVEYAIVRELAKIEGGTPTRITDRLVNWFWGTRHEREHNLNLHGATAWLGDVTEPATDTAGGCR